MESRNATYTGPVFISNVTISKSLPDLRLLGFRKLIVTIKKIKVIFDGCFEMGYLFRSDAAPTKQLVSSIGGRSCRI